MKKISVLVSMIFTFLLYGVQARIITDVSDTDTYSAEIDYVVENELAEGYPDNTFQSDRFINRGEFTKLAINAKFSQSEINSCIEDNFMEDGVYVPIFIDVLEDNTFLKYICMAKIHGVVKGFTGGEYRTFNNITFGEGLKIIMRTLDVSHGISEDADLSEYISRLSAMNGLSRTLNSSSQNNSLDRGETAFLIQIVRDNYVRLSGSNAAPLSSYEMLIRPASTAITPDGLFTIVTGRSHAIFCMSEDRSYINMAINGQSVELEMACSTNSPNNSAEIDGYRFELIQWSKGDNNPAPHNGDLFEYTIRVTSV